MNITDHHGMTLDVKSGVKPKYNQQSMLLHLNVFVLLNEIFHLFNSFLEEVLDKFIFKTFAETKKSYDTRNMFSTLSRREIIILATSICRLQML